MVWLGFHILLLGERDSFPLFILILYIEGYAINVHSFFILLSLLQLYLIYELMFFQLPVGCINSENIGT